MTTAGFLDDQPEQRPGGGSGAAARAGGCNGHTADLVDACHPRPRQDQQASSIQSNQLPRSTSSTNSNGHRHQHQYQPNQEHLKMKQVTPNSAPFVGNHQYHNIMQHSDIIQSHQQQTNQRPNRLLIINQEYDERGGEEDIDDKSSEDDNDDYDVEDGDNDDDDEDDSSEAQLAVASAEEYAAKIIKLQQACLIPLKEDLADWLNKVLKMSSITTENFMNKLDNGVIICRLAKIISLWCEQQLADTESEELTAINVSSQSNCIP